MFAAIALWLSFSVTAAFAQDTAEARNRAVDRYLLAVPTSKMLDEMGARLASTVPTDQRAAFLAAMTDKGMQDALDRKVREVMIKMFKAEELNALADFYGSRAGQNALKKMPEYFAEIYPFLRETMQASVQRATVGAPAAHAQESILPEDFFISDLGKLSDTTRINPGMSTIEIVQHFQRRTPKETEQLNSMTYCIASAIAVLRDAKGWSWILNTSDGADATSRVINVAPMNSEEDAKKYLPDYSHWLPFKTTAQYLPICKHLINAKYLGPDGISGAAISAATK